MNFFVVTEMITSDEAFNSSVLWNYGVVPKDVLGFYKHNNVA